MSTLPTISPQIIQKYQEEMARIASPATAKRKVASLNKFFGWAEEKGHIETNPMPQTFTNSISKPKGRISARTWLLTGTTLGLIVLIFLLSWKLGSPIEFIRNFAAGVENNPTAKITLDNQNILPNSTPSGSISADNASNGSWNLYANLKLSNEDGTPKVGSQTLSFKVYNSEVGGTALYTSEPQTITTDDTGSALISLDRVPSNLFFENQKLFVEPEIASATANARIPVSTANIAANLGGYLPADPKVGANALTVPVIDENGSLNLASESPAINAKAGNLLVQGQALTLKTVDGTNGNIEINPDGKGIAHFLFEGSKGNFLNAQAPNLNSGSLYYGIVANNATGYDLIRLQNGSKPITRFSVDALGNTMATGNINAGGSIQTGGTSRISSTGALQNITGYSQNSGNFVINQNPGDFASVTKTGTALNNAVTMTLDERDVTPNTSYSTLVLNRYNAFGTGMALLVSNGNAQFDGQLKLGNFVTNPTNVGTGSMVYNSTENIIYFWNGSAWVSVGTAATVPFSGLLSGTNTTATMVVGTGASLSTSGTGTISATDLTCSGCVANSELANSAITINAGGILSGGGAVSLGGTLNLTATEADTLDSVTTRGASTTNTLTIGNLIDSGLTANKVVFTDGSKQLTSTGSIGVDQGGTGFSSYTIGDMLYADTTTSLAKLADVATGNVLLSGGIGAAPSYGKVTLGTHTSGNYVSSLAGTANQITASGSTGDITLSIPSDFRAPGTVNAVNGLYTGATAGTQRIDASGNLVNIGTTQLNGITYTWPALDGTNGQVLSTNSTGGLSWTSALTASSVFWDQSTVNGVLFPKNNTIDVLIGSDATSSAKFAFTGVSSGTPTASISGSTSDVATYLTGNGTLATTNMNHLTIGGATTGGVDFGSPITSGTWNGTAIGAAYGGTGQSSYTVGDLLYADSTTSLAKLSDVAVGNVLLSGGIGTAPSWGQITLGTHTTGNYVSSLAGTANQITASGSTGDITLSVPSDFRAPGTVNAVNGIYTGATAGTQRIDASGNLTNIGTTQINGVTYTWPGSATANYVLQSTGTGASSTLAWVDPADAVASSIYWTAAEGALFPKNNSMDVLIGSDATTSAKFAFTGVTSGTPTASISGTYLTSTGNLANTDMKDITLGGATTGNVISSSPFSAGSITDTGLTASKGVFTDANKTLTSTGVLGTDQGGTGLNSYTTGDLIYASSTNTLSQLADIAVGNALISGGVGAAPSWGKIVLGTHTTGNYVSSLAGTANQITASAGTGDITLSIPSDFRAPGTVNAVNGIYTGATAGTQRIDASGNLVNIGTTQLHGITYTWPDADAVSSGYVLSSDAAGQLSWVDNGAGGGGTWTLDDATGTIYPNSQTVDVLIGGIATASAKFAFTGVTSGTPTASIAGTTANVATYINGNGNLSTTNMANLTLGSATTGNVVINSRGITSLTANGSNITIAGDLNSGATTAELFNTTTTSLNVGGAATTINLGPTGSGASSILFGGGSTDTGCTVDGSNGNLACSGTMTATTGLFTSNLQVNNSSATAYNRFGTNTTGHSGGITDGSDLLISSDLELDGNLYLDSGIIANSAGTATIVFSSAPTTTSNTLGASSWLVDNTANVGQAALMVNQQKGGDIFTASASGVSKFTVHNDGAITLAGMASTTNTAEGTIYYDTDVDHLYLRTGDSAFHRIAMDMTKYATTAANIANLGYVEVAHNQNTNDISLTGWVKNTITSLWEKITDKSVTMKQSLQNEFDNASASGKVRTQTRLTDIELAPSVDTGTGADGAITVSGNTSINATSLISARSCADGGDAVNYSVSSLTSTAATLSTTPSAGCLTVGDEVLLINLQGATSAYVNVGNYETLRVSSVSSNTVNFTKSKTKFYGDNATDDSNLGTTAGTQRVMLQRVPNYTTVTVNASQNFYPTAFDGAKGGVIFFRATGAVSISGNIHANAMGYRGATTGGAGGYGGGNGGEAFCGLGGAGGTSGVNGSAGAAGGGGGHNASGANGYCGGGGGGDPAGGTGSAALGGSGGGGLGDQNSGGRAGGGGGYGTYGYGGDNGSNGGTNTSGNGGASGAGGGGGGGTYGDAALADLMFGSGGGAAGQYSSDTRGLGGAGGGIVTISAASVTVSGTVSSNGANGSAGSNWSAGGGGGAGGSVKLSAGTVTLGTNLVSATNGSGGAGGASLPVAGGAGGKGRTAIYYTTSYTGSTNSPTAAYTVQPYYPYGLYHSGVISTPNAVSLSDLRWEATPSAWGKVEFQTRTGNSTNPTDGTWEAWKPAIASTNYLSLQDANTHTDWTGSSATVADGTVTRNVDQFEDEDEGTAGNTTQFVNTAQGGGYAEATIGATDISGYDYLTAWVYATSSGNTVKLGFGEAAGTEQEETVTIDATSTWQKVYWDLSDIVSTSKDGVTKLRVTNLNNPWNTIHFDNFKAEKAMTVSSGSPIVSTPNNYLQYRAIFTTTNTSFQPQVNNVQFSYNNSYKITQTDANNVRLYNYTGQNQELRLDAVVYGADLAEYYGVDNQDIVSGDVVSVSGNLDDYGVPILRKSNGIRDPGLIGVISTKAGQTLGIEAEDRRLLALVGRVPVKVATDSAAIKTGDPITSSSTPGRAKKAVLGEKSIGTALEPWDPTYQKDNVMIFIGNGSSLTPILSDINAYLLNAKVNAAGIAYEIKDATGETINNIGIFSQALIASIKAGVVDTDKLIAQRIQTPLISPLADETDVTVRIGSEATPSGKFAIQNSEGSEVASIDNMGNASFSGVVRSQNIDEIEALLAQVSADQSLLFTATAGANLTASGSANIAELITNDLFVTGNAAMSSVSIADSLTLGSDLVIGLNGNTINSLSAPLQIQSLAMAPVEIMGGLISIDTQGNMRMAGNLYVAGKITTLELNAKIINATGSATLNSVTTPELIVAASDATVSGTIIDGVITTNSMIGQATVPAETSEIIIKNPKVTDLTLVYVTPTSPTLNNVLYVKSKENGQFVVGFTNPIDIDVKFNWWIVQVQ
jgi:hypothetical protein